MHTKHSILTNPSRIRTVSTKWREREREKGEERDGTGGEERAHTTGCERARQRRHRGGSEREKSTKFISGHPRAEPGTNSIASVALFRERAHGTLAGAGVGRG